MTITITTDTTRLSLDTTAEKATALLTQLKQLLLETATADDTLTIGPLQPKTLVDEDAWKKAVDEAKKLPPLTPPPYSPRRPGLYWWKPGDPTPNPGFSQDPLRPFSELVPLGPPPSNQRLCSFPQILVTPPDKCVMQWVQSN